jgi:hypothetical protein
MIAPLSAHNLRSDVVYNGILELDSSVSFDVPTPKIDPEALHGVCGEIIEILEPHTEADPAAVLLTLLTGFGNIMGRNPFFITDGASQHVNLFTSIVGDSSSGRKGTSWENCKGIFKSVDPEWYSSKIMSGIGSGEGIILQMMDSKDAMLEALSDKRLLIKEGEFAQTLQVMSRSGNTVSPMLREAWDGGILQNMTKNNPMKASNTLVSLIAHITRAELTRLISTVEMGNGFANRVLWCHSTRSKTLPDGGNLDPKALDAQIEKIKKAINGIQKGQPFQMTRSAKAGAYWHEIYEGLTSAKKGRWGEVTRRGAAQVVRISMIYALLDGRQEIILPHLKAAEAVWRFCDASARWAFEDHQFSYPAMKLIRALEHEPMSRGEITNKVFNRNLTKKEIDEALTEITPYLKVTWGTSSDGSVVPSWILRN